MGNKEHEFASINEQIATRPQNLVAPKMKETHRFYMHT